MKEITPPLYLPFMQYPKLLSMGITTIKPETWIEPDSLFNQYKRNKLKLYQQNPQAVFAACPESIPAQEELYDKLKNNLSTYHPHLYHMLETQAKQTEEAKLWQASLLVQDDICLLEEQNDNYYLTAASVCAPNDWLLPDKINQPITELHAPVPGLNKSIGTQINHVFNKLTPLNLFVRFNWSIKDNNRLAQSPNNTLNSEKIGEAENSGLFLRVERQTLTRLPKTQAIAFTIRAYIHPLECIVDIPDALASLKNAIENMSNEEAQYKNILPVFKQLRQLYKQYL